MCHHLLHIDLFEPVSDNHHHAIVVTANIEDRIGRHVIGRIEAFPDMVEIPEFCMFNNRVPLTQCIFCLWMFLPELTKHFEGDDVHLKQRSIEAAQRTAPLKVTQETFYGFKHYLAVSIILSLLAKPMLNRRLRVEQAFFQGQ